MRYDLRKRYKGFQAEWYDILTCPHCYFSMLFDYFIEPVRFQKEKIQEALAAAKNETALDFTAERDLDFVFAAHYLALLCSPAFPSKQKQLDLKLWANPVSYTHLDVYKRQVSFRSVPAPVPGGQQDRAYHKDS